MTYNLPRNLDKPILKDIWRRIYPNRSNCFVGITGKVNTGKSETAGRIAYEFNGNRFDMEKHVVYTVDDLIDVALSVVKVKGKPLDMKEIEQMDIDDVEKWLMDNIEHIRIKPGVTIVFDEAGTEVYLREFLSKDNKTISKLIQIWRFLRLIVIVVVPENINILESTIARFLDFEILMLGINRERDIARCIAYEYIGWNKKKREPYKQRLDGCRSVGYFEIAHWENDMSETYRKISEVKKVRAIVRFKGNNKPADKKPNRRCLDCGYEWNYTGTRIKPICPSCRSYKTEATI